MAVLLVGPDDPALNIRAAISAAASGDMILLDPNDTYYLQPGLIDDDSVRCRNGDRARSDRQDEQSRLHQSG